MCICTYAHKYKYMYKHTYTQRSGALWRKIIEKKLIKIVQNISRYAIIGLTAYFQL